MWIISNAKIAFVNSASIVQANNKKYKNGSSFLLVSETTGTIIVDVQNYDEI